jgi:hypothetical protein
MKDTPRQTQGAEHMQKLRKHAALILALTLVFTASFVVLLALLVTRRRLNAEDMPRGHADPTKPGPYDIWPMVIAPQPHAAQWTVALASELIVSDRTEIAPNTNARGLIRGRKIS